MERKFYIYCHLNKINGKRYIGQTCQKPEKRWNSGYGYISCPRFYSAIIHYGWNNFEHIILENNLTMEEANEKEKYYIQFYDTLNKEKGYNMLEGGNSLANYYSLEENREKQSQKRKEYFQTHPEKKQKMVERLKEVSKKSAVKRSEIMKRNYSNQGGLYEINQKRKKKIQCVETQEIFDSITEASKKYDISCGNISEVIHGRRKIAGGYHWILFDENRESQS